MPGTKKIITLTILAFLVLSVPIFAQTLSGMITDMNDHGAVANVIVRNKRTNQIVYSDDKGSYELQAQSGDSILFISQGYYPFQMIMPQAKTLYRQITLERKILSLHEVEIRPGWTPYQLDSIDRFVTYQGALEQKKTTSPFSPFSLIADNVSKKARQRWRFQENFVNWENQKFKDTRYTPEEVTRLTRLEGDSLAAFMNTYPIPYDYARTASDMEIKMWIKSNYREWLKHPYVPDLPEVDFTDFQKK